MTIHLVISPQLRHKLGRRIQFSHSNVPKTNKSGASFILISSLCIAGSPVNTAGDLLTAGAEAPPDDPQEEHRSSRLAGSGHMTQATLGDTPGDRLVIAETQNL